MFAQCSSGVYNMEESHRFCSDTSDNSLRSTFSVILHDPECTNSCCSKDFEERSQIQCNSYDLVQLLNETACSSMESTDSPTEIGNQFLYDTIIPGDAKESKYRDVHHTQEDTIQMAYSDFCYIQQEERKQYTHFCKIPLEAKRHHKENSKGVLKRKRKRTIFTTDQIVAMEGVFKKRPYVSREERLFLTQTLNISEKAIKIWFQNRRRLTERGGKNQSDSNFSDTTVEDIYNTHTAQLDYIEAQIIQNTDERGFVTLDKRVFAELVNVIDCVLSQDFGCIDGVHKNNVTTDMRPSENYIMYEPISPESLSDEERQSENISTWVPSKPEESLQRLIDIHSVLCI